MAECRLCRERCPNLLSLELTLAQAVFPSLLTKEEAEMGLRCCFSCDRRLKKFYAWQQQVFGVHDRLQCQPEGEWERRYECTYCFENWDSKISLRTHIREKHGNCSIARLECRMCFERFPSKEMRTNHERSTHGQSFLCHVCGKLFRYSQNLNIHLNVHAEVRSKEHCNVCQKSFYNRRDARDHMNTHSGVKPYACHCGMVFTGPAHLRQHKRIHNASTYFCANCSRSFTRKSNLAAHILRLHGNELVSDKIVEEVETPKTIGQLSFVEVVRSDSKDHKRKKSDLSQCNICGKVYSHHGSLTYHRRVAHTGYLPFVCSICDAKFAARGALNNHMRRTHITAGDTGPDQVGASKIGEQEPKELFVCEFCGSRFIRKTSLRVHVMTHSDNRPNECPHCSRKFLRKFSLERHVEKCRLRNRYFCPQCGGSFTSKLQAHEHIPCRN